LSNFCVINPLLSSLALLVIIFIARRHPPPHSSLLPFFIIRALSRSLKVALRRLPALQPLLSRDHRSYRSAMIPVKNVIDGTFVEQFVSL
jgi:hypothetical protein